MKIRLSASDHSHNSKPSRQVSSPIRRAGAPLSDDAPLTMPGSLLIGQFDESSQERWLRQQALAMARQNKLDEAIELFDQLIVLYPNMASHYNNRGLLFFQVGRLHLALRDYDQAIALDPQLSQAYNNRANCFAAMDSLEAAVVDYEMALDLNPTNLHARLNLGITFRDLGLYEAAIECFDITLQLSHFHVSDETSKLRVRAQAYAERAKTHHFAGDWNWAVSDYKRGLRVLDSIEQDEKVARLQSQINNWLGMLLQAA
ncbi:MAG TPA: tetratricopeptide repeat protein [Leptolyngbyaceae cyanobacterium M33_DOE_097]|uniref:Tetratricopeptide repeat protein n=1 Tax=Oscillatoriales cyanobacterium SpSt-418 TaxID=2282169 RepID=A0A7C3PEV4_9CYAN|nr:tetratricopeptide repeat protein [Leptolyngbyaceae cyanobacterium M33_DOE_097]